MRNVNFRNLFTLLLAASMLFGSVSCSKKKKAQQTPQPVQKEGKVREYKK
ncbi:MAG TPA: hypothetical protein PK239_11685 [Chitinophagales bacterium]|nr:hypothetical protein [Chitinophagales bacterium]HRK27931.1 hypothetical protein [Chitinophagales bacterium]